MRLFWTYLCQKINDMNEFLGSYNLIKLTPVEKVYTFNILFKKVGRMVSEETPPKTSRLDGFTEEYY